MAKSKGRWFLGGLPYGPAIKKLTERFGVPARGDVIPYEDVEAVLAVPWRSARFKSVTEAWRRGLHGAHGIYLVAVAGEAFRVLTDDEEVTHGVRYVVQGAKRIGKGHAILGTVNVAALTPEDRERTRKAFDLSSDVYERLRAGLKVLAPPKVEALPR